MSAIQLAAIAMQRKEERVADARKLSCMIIVVLLGVLYSVNWILS